MKTIVKKMKTIKLMIVLVLLLGCQEISAQFKFGFGAVYTVVFGSQNYKDKFSPQGEIVQFDFAYIIKKHFESGIWLGLNYFSHSTSKIDDFSVIKYPDLINFSIMPYFRYYFLENNNFRSYILGRIGYNFSTTTTLSNVLFTMDYSAHVLNSRLGLGIQLVRFLDIYLGYAYLGQINRNSKFSEDTLLLFPTLTVDQLFDQFGSNDFFKKT